MNYIGHNQWDGRNFSNFYQSVVNKKWDKVIIFGQNEWQWEGHNPYYFPLLIEHCKNINQKIDVITGSCEYLYPVEKVDPLILSQVNVFYWDTYWLGKTYIALIDTGLATSIDPHANTTFKYTFISMNHKPHRHRQLMIDLLAKENLIDKNAVSVHMENPTIYKWKYFNFSPRILEPEFINDKQQHRLPKQYYESFCQLVSESSEDTIMLSEKTAVPLIIGKPFLVAGQKHFHKFLKDKGFELYDEIFDYSFDDVDNTEERYTLLIKNLIELNKTPLNELPNLQKKIAPKIAFNKSRAREIIYDMKLYPQIALDVIDHYKNTGNEIDRMLIRNHLTLESYNNVYF